MIHLHVQRFKLIVIEFHWFKKKKMKENMARDFNNFLRYYASQINLFCIPVVFHVPSTLISIESENEGDVIYGFQWG